MSHLPALACLLFVRRQVQQTAKLPTARMQFRAIVKESQNIIGWIRMVAGFCRVSHLESRHGAWLYQEIKQAPRGVAEEV